MFFFIDESGNIGNNLFDASQPLLCYGTLSSRLNQSRRVGETGTCGDASQARGDLPACQRAGILQADENSAGSDRVTEEIRFSLRLLVPAQAHVRAVAAVRRDIRRGKKRRAEVGDGSRAVGAAGIPSFLPALR